MIYLKRTGDYFNITSSYWYSQHMEDSMFNKKKPMPNTAHTDYVQPITYPSTRAKRKRSIQIEIDNEDPKDSSPNISPLQKTKPILGEKYLTPKEEAGVGELDKDICVFKQLPESSKLIQSIPLQFRKKVREVIKLYEDQRKNYEIALRRFQKSATEMNQKHMKLSKKSERTAPSYEMEPERNISTIDIEGGLGCYEVVDKHQIFNNEETENRVNEQTQFLKEGFEQLENNYLEEIRLLKGEIGELEGKIGRQNLTISELREEIRVKQGEIERKNEEIWGLQEMNRKLDRTVVEKQKSFRQKRIERMQDLNQQSEIKLNIPPALTVITTRNNSHLSNNRVSPQNSPASATRQRRASLREQLKKSRSFLFSKKQQEEISNTSECQSIDFGKQKVVEKKKLKRICESIVKARNEEEKRGMIEKLSYQIGLKMKDVNFIFNTK